MSPDAHERARGFEHYTGQLNGSADHFSLAPQVFGRSGAVAVAALLLIPLTALASRRRWAAYVVGGSLAIFAITLVPWLFTPFSDVVSLSQSRRLAGFIPFGFALAGGMGVLAALLGRFAAPLALLAGIVLQWQFPGDFGYTLDQGGPAWATWIAVAGALVALVARPLAPALGRDDRGARVGAAPAADVRLRPLALVDLDRAARRARSPRVSSTSSGRPSRPGRSSTRIRSRATRWPPPRPSTSVTLRPGHVADTKREPPLRAPRPVAAVQPHRRPRASRAGATRRGS